MANTIFKSDTSTDTGPELSRVAGSDPVILSSKTAAFFTDVWRAHGDPAGKIGICTLRPGFSNTWFDITEEGIKAAATMAIQLGGDVYFHCASHDPSKATGRGNNDSAVLIPYLWGDIDVAESNKDNGRNYPKREFAINALRNLPVPPSCIVDSGNGLHAYWFLSAPVDAQAHRNLPAVFQAYLRQEFVDKDTGEAYDIDSTGDLARVLRVPARETARAAASSRSSNSTMTGAIAWSTWPACALLFGLCRLR